jgi:hypothetical protein
VVTKEAEIPGYSSVLAPYTCIYKHH